MEKDYKASDEYMFKKFPVYSEEVFPSSGIRKIFYHNDEGAVLVIDVTQDNLELIKNITVKIEECLNG